MARDDRTLLEAWRGGDRDAGGELFDRHYPAVSRFFRGKVEGAATELTQRTFLACLESRDAFRGDASFRTYLFTIARHELYRHLRARRRGPAVLDFAAVSLAELAPTPSQLIARGEEQRLLLAALRRISLEAQLVLELFYWEQQTSKQIAAILGVPHGTARSRLRAARHALEAQLGALSRSPERLASTLDNLERWLRSMQAKRGAAARDDETPGAGG